MQPTDVSETNRITLKNIFEFYARYQIGEITANHLIAQIAECATAQQRGYRQRDAQIKRSAKFWSSYGELCINIHYAYKDTLAQHPPTNKIDNSDLELLIFQLALHLKFPIKLAQHLISQDMISIGVPDKYVHKQAPFTYEELSEAIADFEQYHHHLLFEDYPTQRFIYFYKVLRQFVCITAPAFCYIRRELTS